MISPDRTWRTWFEVCLQVIGVSDVLEGQLQQFLARVADDGAELVVDPQPAAVDADVGDAHRRLVERGPADLLALAQGLVGALPGQRVGEDLRDQLQPLHQRVRPVALRLQGIEGQGADGRLAPDREREASGST